MTASSPTRPPADLEGGPASCRHRAAEPADAPLRHGECAHAPASGPCWTRHRDSGAPPAPRHSSAGTGTGPPVRETAARVAHRTLQWRGVARSEEHTSALQSLMRNQYAVFRLKKNK